MEILEGMPFTFHSLRGERSALILVKRGKAVFAGIPVYVPRSFVEGMKEAQEGIMDTDYTMVPMVSEDGEPRVTTTGVQLYMLG